MTVLYDNYSATPNTHTHTHTHTHIYMSKTICASGCHHNGYVATHVLGCIMYIWNRTSYYQAHELPQSHCGDNREGTLFSWLHIYITPILLLWDLSTLYVIYRVLCMYVYTYVCICILCMYLHTYLYVEHYVCICMYV